MLSWVHSSRAACRWGQSASTAEWAVSEGRTAVARDRGARLDRRGLLQGSLALASLGLLAGCQAPRLPWQTAKLPRIGWLGNAARGEELNAFRHGLGELGYVEGRTIVIEERYSDARMEVLPGLAAELVRLEVDVIVVAAGNPGGRAARGATGASPDVVGGGGGEPGAARGGGSPGGAGRGTTPPP